MASSNEIRLEFENWFSAGNPQCKSIERYADGRYKLISAYNAWLAWQAATEARANRARTCRARPDQPDEFGAGGAE